MKKIFTTAFIAIILQVLSPYQMFSCTHTISLHDSYGDGWHGNNSVTVKVNGTTVLSNITLASGYGPANFNFDAEDGDAIRVTFSSGSWPEECYFDITDGLGGLLTDDHYPDVSGKYRGPAKCTTSGCPDCPSYSFGTFNPESIWQTDTRTFPASECRIYAFNVIAGLEYYFKTGCGDGATADFDTYLEVMDGSCTTISTNDDGCESLRSSITYTPSSSGIIYLKVRGFSGAGGTYTLAYSRELLPGDNCSNAQDLAGLTSPYSATTINYDNDFSNCSMGSSADRIFKMDIPDGASIEMWQLSNNYDSRHTMRYGGACPGTTEIDCIDDSDLTHISWTNSTGSTQTIYWINAGYSSYEGDFVLEWIISPPDPTSINVVSTTVCSGSTTTLTAIGAFGTVYWYTGSCSGSLIGTGNSIDVNPTTNTTYYARNNYDGVWSSSCASTSITIDEPVTTAVSSGDYVWSGNTDSNWETASNWLLFDGSNYAVAPTIPDVTSNVFLRAYSTCASNQANVLTSSTVSCHNLTIETGLYLGNIAKLNITGDWTNNGTFDAGTGTVEFNGSAIQVIDPGASSFNNIILNNSSTGNSNIEILTPMTINGTATFTEGVIYYSGTGAITFGNTASASVSSNNSFVNGLVTKTGSVAFTFPTGDVTNRDFDGAGVVEYAILGAVGIEPSASATIEAEYTFDNTGMPDWWEHSGNMDATIDHVSDREYWYLNSDQDLTTVTLNWFDNAHADGSICVHGLDDGISSNYVSTDMSVAYWDGSMWKDVDYNSGSSNLNHDQGYITSRFAVPFGTKAPRVITFASKNGSNPLPVELVEFKAECNDYGVDFSWITASEKNNDYFILEKSQDLITFTEVIKVEGVGNSNVINYYTFEDLNIDNSKYYRLVQVDIDGQFKAYPPIAINCYEELAGKPTLDVYPNPFNSDITISLNNINDETTNIQIIDQFGRIILENEYNTNFGANNFNLDLNFLEPSIYYLRVSSENYVLNKKIVRK